MLHFFPLTLYHRDPRPLPEPHNDGKCLRTNKVGPQLIIEVISKKLYDNIFAHYSAVTLDQSETDSEDVGIMGAMSELSGPPVASTMRARVGGLAPVHCSSGPINGKN